MATKDNISKGRNHKFSIHVSVENMDEQQAIDYLRVLFTHAGLREVQIVPVDEPSHELALEEKAAEEHDAHEEVDELAGQIREWMAKGQLVWLVVNHNHHNKEARGRVPCRILNFDETVGLLTIYHLDEKKVYTYRLEEIDKFLE